MTQQSDTPPNQEPLVEESTPLSQPEETLPSLEKELEEYKEKYLRVLADVENTRKRLLKDKQEAVRFAMEEVIEEFLLPMDNLENALKHTQGMSPEVANWARGFAMILGQFKEVLTSHGISPFMSLGTPFDPHLHEAVEVEETEGQEGIVLQEYSQGYKSGQRTLRPARVKVSKKKQNNTPEQTNQPN